MKKNLLTLLMVVTIPTCIVTAQTSIWSSDCESFVGWTGQDLDGDGSNWFNYSGGTPFGFASGKFFGSPSATRTPDNALMTPTITIPNGVQNLLFEYKVGSSNAINFAETYGIYIQEIGVGGQFDTLLFQETLTQGGPGSVKNVDISIPSSYAGKSVKLIIRHFNCSNQDYLLMDDFNFSYGSTLSIHGSNFQSFSFGPNPATDFLRFNSDQAIESVIIYDVLGKRVKSFHRSGELTEKIDVSFLKDGIYVIKVQIDEQIKVFKFIKG